MVYHSMDVKEYKTKIKINSQSLKDPQNWKTKTLKYKAKSQTKHLF